MTTAQTANRIDLSNPEPNPATGGIARADDEQAILAEYLAAGNLDNLIPKIARDRRAIERIEAVVRGIESRRLP